MSKMKMDCHFSLSPLPAIGTVIDIYRCLIDLQLCSHKWHNCLFCSCISVQKAHSAMPFWQILYLNQDQSFQKLEMNEEEAPGEDQRATAPIGSI